jgi:ABC-type Na+ efflux pump permease subunit
MTRFAYLGAPAFMFGYGVTRLIDGLDGSHGPGPAWTLGHLMFLVALLLYGVVAAGLRAEVGRLRPLATVAVVPSWWT